MSEVFELAATVVDVLGIAYSVFMACYRYHGAVQNASKESKQMQEQLKCLRDILESVLALDTNGSSNGLDLGSLGKPDGPVSECKAELEALQKKLEPKTGWKGKLDALKWPLNENETNKTIGRLEYLKTTIHLALSVSQTKLEIEIHNGISRVQDTLSTGLEGLARVAEATAHDGRLNHIYEWLAAPDPSTNYNDARQKRQAGTCTWFTESDEFKEWLSKPWSLLWLNGMSGSGKTVLSSDIIGRLGHLKLPVLRFFFDFKDSHKRYNSNLLRSLVTQSCEILPKVPSSVDQLYSKCRGGRTQPSTDELQEVLKSILAEEFKETGIYIVLDALDESMERKEVMKSIKEISGWCLEHFHMLATSRKEPDIEEYITCDWYTVSINFSNTDDIRTHIDETIRNDTKLSKWQNSTKEMIRKALVEGAGGMFRWVDCQLDLLRKCLKQEHLTRALKSLPKTLNDTYEHILANIDPLYRQETFRILQWLAFSARPVTVAEVIDALAVNLEESRFDPNERLPDPEYLLSCCPSLVVISRSVAYKSIIHGWTFKEMDRNTYSGDQDAYSDDDSIYIDDEDIFSDNKGTDSNNGIIGGNRVLSLAHFTVKEYLVSNDIRHSGANIFYLDQQLANKSMSRICLIYLVQFEKVLSGLPSDFPLTRYAAQFWTHHVKSIGSTNNDDLGEFIIRFLQPCSAHYQSWSKFYALESGCPDSYADVLSPLYNMAFAGMERICRRLLEEGAETNKKEGKCGSALNVAAAKGHTPIVDLLIHHGSEVNAQRGRRGSALGQAVASGHYDIIQLLLNHGADVNVPGENFVRPLYTAIYKGKKIVQLLLDHGADVNMQEREYGTALQEAAFGAEQEVVQLLLDHGTDVNLQGGEHNTALQAAVFRGRKDVVQLLLDHGADVNIQGGSYGTSLQAAAMYRDTVHQEIVQLLLIHGANVNVKRGEYGTGLQAAAFGGSWEVVQLLLDHGADVNTQKGKYGTALQAAAFGESQEVMWLGLDVNLDTSFPEGDDSSEQQTADRDKKHQEIVRLLLDHGADVNAKGGEYGTALQAAALAGRQDIVGLLLDHGADVTAQGGKYKNALQAATVKGHLEIMRLLLDRGANVDMQGGNLLQEAIYERRLKVARLLVDRGADVNAKGGEYGTALQAAALVGKRKIMELLLDHGADVNAQGGRYGTALRAAVCQNNQRIVRLLLDRGADMNVQGDKHVDDLHVAAYLGNIEIVRMLLPSIHAQGGKHTRALRAAISRGNKEVVELLESLGATQFKKIDIFDQDEGDAALSLLYPLDVVSPRE